MSARVTLLYEKNERLGFPSRRRPGRSRPDAPTALPLYQWTGRTQMTEHLGEDVTATEREHRSLDRLLPRLECRSAVGVQRFRNDTYGHEYHVSICHRWKGHPGDCKPNTRHSYVESFYDINRSTWPDMSRRRALWSAWKCWRMTRRHTDA